MMTLHRLVLLCCALFAAVFAMAEVAADTGSAERDPRGLDLQRIELPWTGDLDGMVNRRMIRALVVYSKTFYFIDKGTQHGASFLRPGAMAMDVSPAKCTSLHGPHGCPHSYSGANS